MIFISLMRLNWHFISHFISPTDDGCSIEGAALVVLKDNLQDHLETSKDFGRIWTSAHHELPWEHWRADVLRSRAEHSFCDICVVVIGNGESLWYLVLSFLCILFSLVYYVTSSSLFSVFLPSFFIFLPIISFFCLAIFLSLSFCYSFQPNPTFFPSFINFLFVYHVMAVINISYIFLLSIINLIYKYQLFFPLDSHLSFAFCVKLCVLMNFTFSLML